MKKYHIREYSPMWWVLTVMGIAAFVVFMNLPSTLEGVI